MPRGKLAAWMLLSSLASASNCYACRELAVFPEHLDASAADDHAEYYVVAVASAGRDALVGSIRRSLRGPLPAGASVTIHYMRGEEPHAVCPMSFQSGATYLLRLVRTKGQLELSRYDGLNVASTHVRFATYVGDFAPGKGP